MVAIFSLCVLLLATYCYSAPVTQQLNVTTPQYEFTTGHTMVVHSNKTHMHLMTDAESTGVPSLHHPRAAMGGDSSEYTTSNKYGQQPIDHVPRAFNKSGKVDPAEATFLNNFNKFQFTTMESKHQFHKKAIGSTETDLEEAQEPESKREFSENHSAEQAEEPESKREFAEKDSAEQAEESEAKRELSDNHSAEQAEEPESKRELSERDSAEQAEESEAKRELSDQRPDESETESESKRAFSNGVETITTYSLLSGSPSTTYQPIRFTESRENLPQQPTTTYQSMNSAEIRENSRQQQPTTTYQTVQFAESRENSRQQQPTTTYQSVQFAESRENLHQQQPSTTYKSVQVIENSREQPSTTYQSINTAQNSREQPSSVDSFGRNTGLLQKQQPKVVQMTKPVSQSNEEFSTTTSSQIVRQRPIITKTETILPIKVTDIKYFVPKQPVVEAVQSNN